MRHVGLIAMLGLGCACPAEETAVPLAGALKKANLVYGKTADLDAAFRSFPDQVMVAGVVERLDSADGDHVILVLFAASEPRDLKEYYTPAERARLAALAERDRVATDYDRNPNNIMHGEGARIRREVAATRKDLARIARARKDKLERVILRIDVGAADDAQLAEMAKLTRGRAIVRVNDVEAVEPLRSQEWNGAEFERVPLDLEPRLGTLHATLIAWPEPATRPAARP